MGELFWEMGALKMFVIGKYISTEKLRFFLFSQFFDSKSQNIAPFYNPWKHQKTSGFLMFSGGIEGVKYVCKWETWNGKKAK